jgi:DNA-binding NarL/FixJ family response regulator
MGELEEAGRLAAEELALAEAFGTARAIGVALRAVALVDRDEESTIELLRQAEKVLEDSVASLELARTRADLGAALRRANMRMEARAPLRAALDAAHHCGATALAHRCWTELSATGARPPRVVRTGLDALTPSELRVAQLAREGLTIREIAQALFLSRKTVEKHLGQAYSKLGVHSREELQQRTEQPMRMAGDSPSGEAPSSVSGPR